MAPLAAIMKSSMRSFARLRSSAARPLTWSPSKRAWTSIVSSSSAPCSWRPAFSRWATWSCNLRFSASAGTAAAAGGRGPRPSSHAPTLG